MEADIEMMHLQAKESQGLLAITRNQGEFLEEPRKGSSLEPSNTAWPCRHPDFGFLASRTVGEYVILSHPVCSNLLYQPQETNTFITRFQHPSFPHS